MTWQSTTEWTGVNPGGFEESERTEILYFGAVRDVPSLRRFVRGWIHEQLVPVELPFVRWAYESAARGDSKGLIELDRRFGESCLHAALRDAGIRVGRQQLRNLSPLRDQKLLRRYREATEAGEAAGHHAVVHGVFLHLYSIPLREGLLTYAYQAVNGFVTAASRAISFRGQDPEALVKELCAALPRQIESSLAVPRPRSAHDVEPLASNAGEPRT